MIMVMFRDWLFCRHHRSGSCDDSLVVRSHGDVYGFARSGDSVLVLHNDDLCILEEPGLGGMMSMVIPRVMWRDDCWESGYPRLMDFLDDVVVPFARWSGLSTCRFGDAGVDFSGFGMVGWCNRHYYGGSFACTSERESIGYGFHLRATSGTGKSMDFSTIGVLLGDGSDGDGHDAYLVLCNDFLEGKNFVDANDWNRIVIGPFAVDDLVHELRLLCDSGCVTTYPSWNAGLVVELAKREASLRTGVPRNVALNDIIDGYPGADEYMDKHGSCIV